MSDKPQCSICNDRGWTQYRNEYVKLGRVPCVSCDTGAEQQRELSRVVNNMRAQLERDAARGDSTDGLKDYSSKLKGSDDE